jgi:eukaryotic-like serine/threonine-protein kinase
MTLHVIKLPGGEWEYDDAFPLGKAGGFGEVFRGCGAEGDVAVKRLKIDANQAAHRELKIGQQLMQRTLLHIVPITDAGQDSESDRYFLIMPVCEFSLQDIINKRNGSVDMDTASEAITGIIAGLSEVKDITHRDLKPANILYHAGKWKIADFGIAKFVEDSTSMETLRDSLTPTYAAPEQWLGERPTTATDIYALGCIIYALFMGRPPFLGSIDDIRESHLHSAPNLITNLPPRFAAFVSHMLRKPPNARPTLLRCAQVFSELKNSSKANNGTHPLIEEASKRVAETEAREEAERQAAATLQHERNELFKDAKTELLAIRDRLFSKIRDSSESVRINTRGNQLNFGLAELEFSREPMILNEFTVSRHASGVKPYHHTGWDVLAWSIISIKCQSAYSNPYIWSASLLFTDRKDGTGYRWYEVAFWTLSGSNINEPFGLEGYEDDIDIALARNIIHTVNVAYGPFPIDGEDEESFISRWINLVAKAAIGKLSRPMNMPISDFG